MTGDEIDRLRKAADELESWHETDEYELRLADLLRAIALDPNMPHCPDVERAAVAMAGVIVGLD